ncbi:hypothetical protein OESDEN_23614 [Oesophagostomum dentatum]|uniref:Uncharacterized protein n=1 Tax=Oesophagostomum dentatum TaxID=61180 RepID=A0A0B1RYP3_OESDE|nr:hypothetical protein OESDEN_23614 [Oesophagostomum dentatum]
MTSSTSSTTSSLGNAGLTYSQRTLKIQCQHSRILTKKRKTTHGANGSKTILMLTRLALCASSVMKATKLAKDFCFI